MERELYPSMGANSDGVTPNQHPVYPQDNANDPGVKNRGDTGTVCRDRTSPVSIGGGVGRRSPTTFLERTTTIRFVLPSTGKLMCSKLNRVVRTKAPRENDVCLCENFLKGNCEEGGRCHLAHVPRQCLWEYLVPRVNTGTLIYEEGFSICCYNPSMTAFYHIPSEYIFQTRGSERYIELYNDNGDNFKEKLRLCSAMTTNGCCKAGYECEDVHCSVADLSAFPCIHTHIATEDGVRECERLPADIVVLAHLPNSGAAETRTYTGDDVLRTVGATQYEEAYRREGGVPSVKMQHCAHFQNKKMCRLGHGCRFLHVVSLALSTPAQEESGMESPVGRRLSQATSPVVSPLERRLQSASGGPSADALAAAGAPAAAAKVVGGVEGMPSRAMRNGAALMAIVGFINGGNTAPLSSMPTAGGIGTGSEGRDPRVMSNNHSGVSPLYSPIAVANTPSAFDTVGAPPMTTASTATVHVATPNAAQGSCRRSPVRRHNPYILSPNSISL